MAGFSVVAAQSSSLVESYLRHRDLVFYPLRKLIHSLDLGIRYDNSVSLEIRAVFKTRCADLSPFLEFFESAGFQQTGNAFLKKGVSEPDATFVMCAEVTPDSVRIFLQSPQSPS